MPTLSIPPAYVWIMRLQWGLWAILAKLDASGSYGAPLDGLFAASGEPLVNR